MEILVAILIIALIAAIAFIVMQRRPAGARVAGARRPFDRHTRRNARRDPMTAAVVEHAEATDPHDVVVAEQRMRAEARRVAAPMQAEAQRVEDQRAADAVSGGGGAYPRDPSVAGYGQPVADPAYTEPVADPAYGQPVADPAYTEPVGDPAYEEDDPRYNDRRYDGRLAADWVDPRGDDPRR
ncbi:MAG: hypothetical protein QOG15_936 [Solirubrobacteraceae bacterium]|jgi:hypothetical protein|nr:hypothetical protein [Solirubrobacteraceae bacterium]